ncbi:MAG: hypothetical protein UY27_C0031G0001, partial [Candidatus Gottesmanbacteria bacterium GW2011_GWA1_48_13]
MDPVQDQKTNLPPTIIPTTEEAVSPPPPTPVIDPSITPAPAPVSDNAQVVKPKKKWGTGALIGSVAALMVMVVGLGFGVWQVKRNQEIKQSKAGGGLWNQCGQGPVPCGSCSINSVSNGSMTYGCELNCGGSVSSCPPGSTDPVSIAHRWEKCSSANNNSCNGSSPDYISPSG